MNQIRTWYVRNQTEITWFLIGVLTLTGLEELSRGDYAQAAISFGLVALNYAFRKPLSI